MESSSHKNSFKNTGTVEQSHPEQNRNVSPPEVRGTEAEVTDDAERDQDPGMRQKENQNQQQEDDLAA